MSLDSTALNQSILRAHQVLQQLGRTDLEKAAIWGSPAGKSLLAERIVAEITEHRVYVEPFAGGAAVFFKKKPSEVEVLNDIDSDIAFAFRYAKNISSHQIVRLRRKKWVGDKEHYLKLRAKTSPKNSLERFYRFAYLSRFSFNGLRYSTMANDSVGVTARFVDRLERHAPRLKNIKVRCADYEKVIEEFDSPNTFFFLDPPYAGYDAVPTAGRNHQDWDEERFGRVLRKIKGKFLCTYGIRGDKNLFNGFHVRRWRHMSGVGTNRGAGMRQSVTQVITNYIPGKKKVVQEAQDISSTKSGEQTNGFVKSVPLIKGVNPKDERFVLGIVLEPEVVDAQGDIYSVSEVRAAAHRFMEEFGGLGVMHRFRVNGDVKILESYLAPLDFELGGTAVRQGTWLLAVRILSDQLWEQIKSGELNGFSVGGSARSTGMQDSQIENEDPENTVAKSDSHQWRGKIAAAVRRLIDILVEEVSLVDRAANQHRFLIVKRSEGMEMDQETADQSQLTEDKSAATEPMSDGKPETSANDDQTTEDENSPLGVAVEALTGITSAVEAIASLNTEDAKEQLIEFASSLNELSDRLAVALGVSPDKEDEQSQSSSELNPRSNDEPSVAPELLASVRDTLQRVGDLIESSASRKSSKDQSSSDKRTPQDQTSSSPPVAKGEGELAGAVRSLVDAVKAQQQRLARLEKRFGLPNSLPTDERVTKRESEDTSWPLDLNKPVDRKSVDRSVSFHDV